MRSPSAAFIAVCALATLQIAFAARADEDPTVQCVRALAAESRFDAIRTKISIPDMRGISFEMLANDAIPTAEERKAISDWFAGQDACATLGASWRDTHYPPEVNAIGIATSTKVQLIGVDLYKGKTNYSDANKRVAIIRDELLKRLSEIIGQYKQEMEAQQALQAHNASVERAQVERQQETDEAQRQRAYDRQAQSDYQAQQQRLARQRLILNFFQANRIPMPRRPVQTNCMTDGNQTNCTSQ